MYECKKKMQKVFKCGLQRQSYCHYCFFELYFNYISYQQRATRLLSLTVIDAVNNFSVIHSRKKQKDIFFPCIKKLRCMLFFYLC